MCSGTRWRWAPSTPSERIIARSTPSRNFSARIPSCNIPNGIPGIEDRVNLLYTYGVKRGRLDLDRFVDAASTRAAKLFGLFPRKGTIAVGSDADLVVYDPNYRGAISAKSHHVNNDYNGFEGMEIEGRPSVVTVRGKVQVRDGKFVGERGRGKMLKREPTHF